MLLVSRTNIIRVTIFEPESHNRALPYSRYWSGTSSQWRPMITASRLLGKMSEMVDCSDKNSNPYSRVFTVL